MKLSHTLEGRTITFTISGNLDATTCLEVRERFDEAVAANPEIVVVDLSGLRLIDSSGVGAIVSLFKRIRGAGGVFEVRGVGGQPLSIFKVLRLDKVFQIPEASGSRKAAANRSPSSPPEPEQQAGNDSPQTQSA
jgi:anti-sigma B factor antagonist